jgi:hypothetical protein
MPIQKPPSLAKSNIAPAFRRRDNFAKQLMEEELASSQDTHTSVPEEIQIYKSSNGDTWYLCENPATSLPTVKHVANPQSGGHIAYLEVESFLSTGRGPEHEALRELIKRDHFATVLIAYDIHSRQDDGYAALVETIQSLGAWWHHLETVWIVRSHKTPEEIRDKLATHISADDQLLVADITGVAAEWAGLNEAGSTWLRMAVRQDALVA